MENRGSLLFDEPVKKVLELAPLGAFQTDLQGNCLYVNKEFENICGLQMQDLAGARWLNSIAEEDLPIVTSSLKTLVSEQKNSLTLTYSICHPKKGMRYCKANIKPVFSDTGDPLYFIGYLEDISSERTNMEYIKLQNELLAILKNIQDKFYLSETPATLFNDLLTEVIKISKSEFGFISEAGWLDRGAEPHWKKLASTGINWRNTREHSLETKENKLFEDNAALFKKLPGNAGAFVLDKNKDTYINEDVFALLVLPATINGRVEGMIVLANREGGYPQTTIDFLNPLLSTFTTLLTFQKLSSEKKMAEEKQKDLTTHLQTLITSLEDIIFELDGNKVFKNVWVSDEKILFMPRELFIGKSISEVFGPLADMFNAPVDEAIRTAKETEITYQHIDATVDKWYRPRSCLFIPTAMRPITASP